jgi:hypothetical protein
MLFRSLVASFCTICSIAAVFPPTEGSARSGGLTIGRGPMFARPFVRPGPRTAVRVGRGPVLLAKGKVVHPPPSARPITAQRFHRVFDARLPRNGIGAYYGSLSNPGDFTGVPSVQTAAYTPALLENEAVIGRRCGSQIVVVPSEAGGERPITIRRCRSD